MQYAKSRERLLMPSLTQRRSHLNSQLPGTFLGKLALPHDAKINTFIMRTATAGITYFWQLYDDPKSTTTNRKEVGC